jgi:hypothetical protein
MVPHGAVVKGAVYERQGLARACWGAVQARTLVWMCLPSHLPSHHCSVLVERSVSCRLVRDCRTRVTLPQRCGATNGHRAQRGPRAMYPT